MWVLVGTGDFLRLAKDPLFCADKGDGSRLASRLEPRRSKSEEKIMSVAGITSNLPQAITQSFLSQRRTDIIQLGEEINSGDLAGAQQVYSALTTLGQNTDGFKPFKNPILEQDFSAVGLGPASWRYGRSAKGVCHSPAGHSKNKFRREATLPSAAPDRGIYSRTHPSARASSGSTGTPSTPAPPAPPAPARRPHLQLGAPRPLPPRQKYSLIWMQATAAARVHRLLKE
jgi:hypothetical protein